MSSPPPPEPYRIKAVEPIPLTTRAERARIIEEAGYNLFNVPAEKVTIDLLTDSGVGAMSAAQWAGLMQGDESYAGSRSFETLRSAVRELLGFPHVLPTHQGRGAENVLNAALAKAGDAIPGNAHFDTTRAHIEHRGASPVDCTVEAAKRPSIEHPFKGNVDLEKLERAIEDAGPGRVPYVLVTLTCNSAGGQPVSMENLRAVAKVARSHRIPLILDIARFAENALFVKDREPGYRGKTIAEIAREMMDHADGAAMSAKKNALVNIGGFLAVRSKEMYDRLAPYAVLYEGYVTYGGLAGRDLEAMAIGLREGVDEAFLRHYTGQVRYLGERLVEMGVPVVRPIGGHAVYIDAAAFLPHVPWDRFPGQALAVELYVEGGVRACEIGSLMVSRDPESHANRRADLELTRLALPRRMYTREHLDLVADAVKAVWDRRAGVPGYGFVDEPPVLRHFMATFRPIAGNG
ncbi:MAG: tryptophanase [Methanobacteriota archaeon]